MCGRGGHLFQPHRQHPVYAVTPASIQATRGQVPVPRVGLGPERIIIDGILPLPTTTWAASSLGPTAYYMLQPGASPVAISAIVPSPLSSRTPLGQHPAFPATFVCSRCASVEEFDGMTSEQVVIMAKNCDSGDYKMKTCSVQVSQDMERFWEIGYVSEGWQIPEHAYGAPLAQIRIVVACAKHVPAVHGQPRALVLLQARLRVYRGVLGPCPQTAL